MFVFDAYSDAVVRPIGPEPKDPRALIDLDGRTLFLARDQLGVAFWIVGPAPQP